MCYQSIVSARTQLPFSSSAIHFLLTSSAFFEAAPADGLIQSHHLRQVRVHGFRIDRCLRRGGCGCLVVDFKWVQQLYRYIECCRSWEAILTTAALVRPSHPFRTSCTIPSFHGPWQSLTNTYWYLRVAVTWASFSKMWAWTSLKLLRYSVHHRFQIDWEHDSSAWLVWWHG